MITLDEFALVDNAYIADLQTITQKGHRQCFTRIGTDTLFNNAIEICINGQVTLWKKQSKPHRTDQLITLKFVPTAETRQQFSWTSNRTIQLQTPTVD